MISSEPPLFAWSRKLSDPDPSPLVHTFSRPAFMDAISLLPLAYRMGQYISNERKNFREPIFDLSGITLEPPKPGPYAGVPCGGIGGGCIGRGYRGDFRRWSLFPGRYAHRIVYTDQFSLRIKRLSTNQVFATVLSVVKPPQDESHRTCRFWNWNMNPDCATYHAVFPRAWTVYEEPLPGVRVVIRQVSPFIPHNYSDSSLPVCLFHVDVENIGSDPIEASVMFTFQNGDGGKGDAAGGFIHSPYTVAPDVPDQDPVYGVFMSHHRVSNKEKRLDQGSFAVSVLSSDEVSYCKIFISEKPIIKNKNRNQNVVDDELNGNEETGETEAPPRQSTFFTSFIENIRTAIDSSMFGETDVYTGSEDADLLWSIFRDTGSAPISFSNDGNDHISNTLFQDQSDPTAPSNPSQKGFKVASALCVNMGIIEPQITKSASFSLAWDFPICRFGSKKECTASVPRYYTRFFGTSGLQAFHIATYALLHKDIWEDAIISWQSKLVMDLKASNAVPDNDDHFSADYYQYHLFNELYYLVDGGTIWSNTSHGHDNPSDELFHAFTTTWSYDEKNMMQADNINKDSSGIHFGMHDIYKSNSNDLSNYLASLSGSRSRRNSEESGRESYNTSVYIDNDSINNNDPANEERIVLALQSISLSLLSCLSVYMRQHSQMLQYSNGQQDLVGQFLYYEGHEYLMYNTYDVHFYASFALLQLFPQLELSIQRDFAQSVLLEDPSERIMIGEGHKAPRKVKSVVPHDLGSPTGYPWKETNSYNFQDVSNWKDLGPKFILQVYRDYKFLASKLHIEHIDSINAIKEKEETTFTYDEINFEGNTNPEIDIRNEFENDDNNPFETVNTNPRRSISYGDSEVLKGAALDFIKEMYPICEMIMNYCMKFDTNLDGMIENSGFPDQTYDIWIADGVHAYCGGLWVAACTAMSEITELIASYNKHLVIGDNYDYYHILSSKASYVYITKLWNGRYFDYDSSNSDHHDSIMADMLAGQWYAHVCGLSALVVSSEMAYSCIETIYEANVIKFGQGRLLGAVNGMRPSALKSPLPKNSLHNDEPMNQTINTPISQTNPTSTPSIFQQPIWNIFQQQSTVNDNHYSSVNTNTNGNKIVSMDIDTSCLQSKEVWTGTTYALAALMLHEAYHMERELSKQQMHNVSDEKKQADTLKKIHRLRKMAYNTARGIHDAGWKEFGYWFATPEAWEQNGNYRSLGYMRPLAIWAMQLANMMD